MVLLSVVTPTFNEATHIQEFLKDVSTRLQGIDFEIVVVDDNSPDGTHRRVVEFAQTQPRVVPVLRTHEKGLATAVIEGMRRARGRYVVVMDSDFQHPTERIPALLQAAQEQGADLVVGSRYVEGGGNVGFTTTRHIISWGAKTIARLGLPITRHFRIRDPMSGFFLVEREKVPIDRLRPRGYKILLEVLARASLHKVVEVGYVFQLRRAGASKLRLKTQRDYFLHVLGLALQDRENRRLATFALVGLSGIVVHLLVLTGLVDGLDWAQRWFLRGYDIGILLAAVVAREVAILWNFAWNDRITFHDKRAHAHARFFLRMLRFHLVSVWAFLAYLVVYYPLVLLGTDYRISAVVAILASFLLNYAGNVRWTYAKRKDTPHP